MAEKLKSIAQRADPKSHFKNIKIFMNVITAAAFFILTKSGGGEEKKTQNQKKNFP